MSNKCPKCGHEWEEDEVTKCPECGEELEIVDPEIEAFNNMEAYEFRETLDLDDIYAFNVYLVKTAMSNIISRIMFAILGIIVIVMPIYLKENYWIIAFGALLLVYSAFLYLPLQKLLIKKRLNSKEFKNLNIVVRFNETYIQYKLEDENKTPLIKTSDIRKVIYQKDYIYLYINVYSYVVVKLKDQENPEAIKEQIQKTFKK